MGGSLTMTGDDLAGLGWLNRCYVGPVPFGRLAVDVDWSGATLAFRSESRRAAGPGPRM